MQMATRADAPAIAELDMQLFPENCFNERTLAREIDAGSGFVIYDRSTLVAYLLVRWDWAIVDITRIGIRPSHQGRGLGTKLLLHVIGSTRLDIVLCVNKVNNHALRLYHNHGFRIIGQLKKSWVMLRPTSQK